MKRLLLVFAGVFAGVVTAYAGSAGGNAPAVGRVNVPLTVPKATKSICKNLATGKTGTASFDVSGTTMINWKGFTSPTNTTAVTLERRLGTNAAGTGIPSTGEYNLPVENGISTMVFGKYSSADNSVTPRVCVDMN